MRLSLLPLSLAAAFAATMAFASETATGTVESIDAEAGTFVLAGDATYSLPEEFDVSAIEVGSTVTVTYDMDGDQKVVLEVAPAE